MQFGSLLRKEFTHSYPNKEIWLNVTVIITFPENEHFKNEGKGMTLTNHQANHIHINSGISVKLDEITRQQNFKDVHFVQTQSEKHRCSHQDYLSYINSSKMMSSEECMLNM